MGQQAQRRRLPRLAVLPAQLGQWHRHLLQQQRPHAAGCQGGSRRHGRPPSWLPLCTLFKPAAGMGGACGIRWRTAGLVVASDSSCSWHGRRRLVQPAVLAAVSQHGCEASVHHGPDLLQHSCWGERLLSQACKEGFEPPAEHRKQGDGEAGKRRLQSHCSIKGVKRHKRKAVLARQYHLQCSSTTCSPGSPTATRTQHSLLEVGSRCLWRKHQPAVRTIQGTASACRRGRCGRKQVGLVI